MKLLGCWDDIIDMDYYAVHNGKYHENNVYVIYYIPDLGGDNL